MKLDETLRAKIIELFEYRKLPELITFGGNELDIAYYEQLIELQYQIYKLDHELESNWEVDQDIINARWSTIYQALEHLGVPDAEHDSYCRHIYKYQKHELDIRQMKLPTRLSMEYFYFYKSCDVKLLRKIIYKNNPSLAKAIKESDWRLFDLVTEINDDVADLQEDITTINGNRFLISLKLIGEEQTNQIFTDFLNDVSERNKAKDLVFQDLDIKEWTGTQVEETISLIHSQIKEFDVLDTSLYDRLLPDAINSAI